MATQPKPKLSADIRASLLLQHNSIPRAADVLGLPYERLKKALQQNRFSDEDLRLLRPESTIDDLSKQYTFDHSRPYNRSGKGPDEARARQRDGEEFSLFEQISGPFQLLQRAAAATDFESFVADLFAHKLNSNYSMVLFCRDMSVPIEWLGGNRSVLLTVANALCNGSTIIYVMEIDLANEVTPEPQEIDLIDRRFFNYLESLREACRGITSEAISGLIALLRVPRCSFCIPYQKPALFTQIRTDDELNVHHALTTIELPETICGSGEHGIVVLPQRADVAAHMTEYLRALIRHIKRADTDRKVFHFDSEPKLKSEELVERLHGIVG